MSSIFRRETVRLREEDKQDIIDALDSSKPDANLSPTATALREKFTAKARVLSASTYTTTLVVSLVSFMCGEILETDPDIQRIKQAVLALGGDFSWSYTILLEIVRPLVKTDRNPKQKQKGEHS